MCFTFLGIFDPSTFNIDLENDLMSLKLKVRKSTTLVIEALLGVIEIRDVKK